MRDLTQQLVSQVPKGLPTPKPLIQESVFLHHSANIVLPTQFLTIRLQVSELSGVLKALQSPFPSQVIDSAQVELQTR